MHDNLTGLWVTAHVQLGYAGFVIVSKVLVAAALSL